jgi:hypothetical protein
MGLLWHALNLDNCAVQLGSADEATQQTAVARCKSPLIVDLLPFLDCNFALAVQPLLKHVSGWVFFPEFRRGTGPFLLFHFPPQSQFDNHFTLTL